MSAPPPPRHLAPRRRDLRARQRLLAATGAAVALTVGAAAIALIAGGPPARSPSGRPPPGASPTAGSASSSSAPPTTARPAPTRTRGDTTTTGPAQPIRPIPGNLLANGDFEGGLGGWGALGAARMERVAVAHSGRWAVRIGPATDGVAPARLGIASPLVVEARPGRTYRGRAWVRTSRPGTEVTLALREQAGDGQSSADVIGLKLPDSGWHEVAVAHQLQLAGARLSLELTSADLGAGDLILIDEVGVTAP